MSKMSDRCYRVSTNECSFCKQEKPTLLLYSEGRMLLLYAKERGFLAYADERTHDQIWEGLFS